MVTTCESEVLPAPESPHSGNESESTPELVAELVVADAYSEGQQRASHTREPSPGAVSTAPQSARVGSPDRRILKAFYTQYVAVLLIVLTFSAGAFQRTLTGESSSHPLIPKRVVTLGTLTFERVFDPSGALDLQAAPLEAMAQVLGAHDVNLEVEVAIPRLSLRHESPTPLERGIRRVRRIESFFEERGVVPNAVTVALVEGSEQEPVTFRFLPAGDIRGSNVGIPDIN